MNSKLVFSNVMTKFHLQTKVGWWIYQGLLNKQASQRASKTGSRHSERSSVWVARCIKPCSGNGFRDIFIQTKERTRAL